MHSTQELKLLSLQLPLQFTLVSHISYIDSTVEGAEPTAPPTYTPQYIAALYPVLCRILEIE